MAETGSNTAGAHVAIGPNSLALVDFILEWERGGVAHRTEKRHRRINLWRDFFPAGLDEALSGARAGDIVTIDCPPGSLVPDHVASDVFEIPLSAFRAELLPGTRVAPDFGRFFPRGVLEGVRGTFRQDRRPFRCLDLAEGRLTVDFNHSFAGIAARLSVHVLGVAEQADDVGGRSTDWAREVTDGPGIEARANGLPTDFFYDGAFERVAEDDDAVFYAKPRMTVHLDSAALGLVTDLYRQQLGDGMAVLDLMASLHSHLPEERALRRVAGLGLNEAELAANGRLTDYVVHDLNARPALPYDDGEFDAVVSTVSVEYLTDPIAVIGDAGRVLKPGGTLALTFSHRWFPPKVIAVWREVHPFERIGLVAEYVLRTGLFEEVRTLSIEGLPRPADDPYAASEAHSDPVFAVVARRGGGH
ncbi:MAG: methyltransferase domain-containing protein [Hyphomicrobiales bacterium]